MWMLGTESGSSARAASAPNCRAISAASFKLLFVLNAQQDFSEPFIKYAPSHKTVLQLPARKEPQRQDVYCVAQLSARTRDRKHGQPEERGAVETTET